MGRLYLFGRPSCHTTASSTCTSPPAMVPHFISTLPRYLHGVTPPPHCRVISIFPYIHPHLSIFPRYLNGATPLPRCRIVYLDSTSTSTLASPHFRAISMAPHLRHVALSCLPRFDACSHTSSPNFRAISMAPLARLTGWPSRPTADRSSPSSWSLMTSSESQQHHRLTDGGRLPAHSQVYPS